MYFLKAEELNVDKARIDFFNISNITMGRVTSLNASMCIRSDKKDRKDIANLIKKLEKFNIKDSDENKGRVHRADGPDQLEDDQ